MQRLDPRHTVPEALPTQNEPRLSEHAGLRQAPAWHTPRPQKSMPSMPVGLHGIPFLTPGTLSVHES